MTISPILVFHIGVGAVALVSGCAALIYKKGSRNHKLAGKMFVVFMLAMTTSGAYLAFMKPATIAFIVAILTFYLIVTSWMAVRRKAHQSGGFEIVAFLVAMSCSLAAFYYGHQASISPDGFIEGNSIPVEAYYFFGIIAALAAALDLRYIIKGGVSATQRVVRHLWRMSFALYIATSSFFSGNPQVFPQWLHDTSLLPVPETLVFLAMLFWLVRVPLKHWLQVRKSNRRTSA